MFIVDSINQSDQIILAAEDTAYHGGTSNQRRRLTLFYHEPDKTWQIKDEPTSFLVKGLRIFIKINGKHKRVELSVDLNRSAEVKKYRSLNFDVFETTYNDKISRISIITRWELDRSSGTLILSLQAETMAGKPIGDVFEVYCEGVVSFGGNFDVCRLSPSPQDEHILQMSSGDADNNLNNALYCRDNDAAAEFLSPSTKLLRIRGRSRNDDKKAACRLFSLATVTAHAFSRILSVKLSDQVFGKISPFYKPRPDRRCFETPSGWHSYYCLYEEVSEAKILPILDFVEKHLVPFGMKYFTVVVWQANHILKYVNGKPISAVYYEYWDEDNYRFPRGMKWLAGEIKFKGLKPGIWAKPFGTGDEVFYYTNKEVFLHNSEGKPLGSPFNGPYILDPTRGDVKKFLSRHIELMSKEWGYDYLELDGLSAFCDDISYSEAFYKQKEVINNFSYQSFAPYRDCIQVMDKAMGEDTYFLACGGTYDGACAGLADGARIGYDTIYSGEDPTWKAVLKSATQASEAYFVHNRVWHNDPDVFMLRPPLTDGEVKAFASSIALTGQILYDSDILPDVPFERIAILQKILPVIDINPDQLFPVQLKNVYDLKVRRSFEQWDVVGFFNWSEDENAEPLDIETRFGDLGLPENGEYLLYDFWGDRFIGTFIGSIKVRIKPHACEVYSIRSLKNEPQVVSINRHISQGGTCLKELSWDSKIGRLSGKSEVIGNYPYVISVNVPERWKFVSASLAGQDKAAAADGSGSHLNSMQTIEAKWGEDESLKVAIESNKTGMVNWLLEFSKNDEKKRFGS